MLIEQRTYTMLDEVWVTTLSKQEALHRVIKRNPNLSEQAVRDRIERQIDDKERLEHASFHYDTGDSTSFETN